MKVKALGRLEVDLDTSIVRVADSDHLLQLCDYFIFQSINYYLLHLLMSKVKRHPTLKVFMQIHWYLPRQ